jgi:flagellar protein FliJ
MAKQIKKGKFKYNLKAVLKVREIRERQEKEKFAETQRKLEEEKKKEERMIKEHLDAQTELRGNLDKGKQINFSRVFLMTHHVKQLKENAEIQKKVKIEADKRNEDQRHKLIEKIKEKKVIEKDKQNKFKKWEKIMDKEETNFLDDISTSKFCRDKLTISDQ